MTEPTDLAYWQALNDPVVDEFRANEGTVNGFNGADVLLLTTTGAKSGQPRLTPLAYFMIDGKLIIVGSKGGFDRHPDWVHNLRANPRAHVEVGDDGLRRLARELPSVERDDTYPKVVALQPGFGDYRPRPAG